MIAEMNVYGHPAPQGSHSAYVNKRTGRAVIMHGSSASGRLRHKEWRATVEAGAKAWLATQPGGQTPFSKSTPMFVGVVFRMPEPKSKLKRLLHDRRPDLDKLQRSTLDSLVTSGLLPDDNQVAVIVAAKRWHNGDHPGAEILVREARDEELEDLYECWL
jgi:crossover junction endodeoxyribonuclease RusA